MKEDLKQVTDAILSNPKTGYIVATLTTIETWWIDWGNPLVDATASILGVILLIVLIRKHWNSTENKGD